MVVSSRLVMFGPSACVGCRRRAGWLCDTCASGCAAAGPPAKLPGIPLAVAAWRYEGAARSLILALKLRAAREAALPLIDAIATTSRRTGVEAECVTWVPARRRDARSRGFDHAELLARGVGEALGLSVLPLLRRAGIQADQAGLGRAARLANLEGAFVATDRIDRSVLLVDDLVTTGATATACAAALRAAGAPRVELATACRA